MSRLQSIEVPNLAGVKLGSTVWAHGHADDHYRLVATIASRLDPSLESDEARCCTTPTSSWKERRDALVRLGMQEPKKQLDIIDIDALDVGFSDPADQWADLLLREDRSRFLDELVPLAARAGWRLVRLSPSKKTSDLIRGEGAEITSEGSVDPLDAMQGDRQLRVALLAISPEARRVAVWLLQKEHVGSSSLRRLLEEEGEGRATQLVIGMAYDVLSWRVRQTALSLAAIREEVQINGVVGPYRLVHQAQIDRDAARAPQQHVNQLLECGFLQRRSHGQGQVVRMPRSVRQYLESRAWARSARDSKSAHALMLTQGGDSLDDTVSRHWHAVCAGDQRTALETAKYYVSDLRLLAYRLSKEQRDYETAAELYQRVVDADDQDAYAWEYLGFNLARHAGRSQCASAYRPRIECAFRRAVDLDPMNPLYHGRLLGYLGRCGEDVTEPFAKGIERFAGRYQGPGVTWFAEPVLRGLQGRRARGQLRTICEQWRDLLTKHDRLRPLLAT